MIAREYTALFPFGGSGGGALGFLDAEVRLLGRTGRFRALGSLDFDALACADFERFTGSPAWCVDIEQVKASDLLVRYGMRAPDVVFMSPPCKGSSRLLGAKKAAAEKYQRMNRLALVWTRAMLAAWGEAPPALVLLENVPGLPRRAAKMLTELRSTLRAAGYVFATSTHDCGELGGLGQHRERFLLVARHPSACSALLYKPVLRRVRAVGEVLCELPMPGTIAARTWGALHEMPRTSWRNLLRLAHIPAGGDWRDLDGVLRGRKRREVFRRHPVGAWNEPSDAITGPGGHSVEAIADPRVEALRVPVGYDAAYGVLGWDQAARTIAGNTASGCGAYAVADPRSLALAEDVRVLTLDEAMSLDLDPDKPPPFTALIVADDGTCHRPMTLLELSLLQGYPAQMHGKPIAWAGGRTIVAEHIGNSVPPPTARAIAEQMLISLIATEAGEWVVGQGGFWVTPTERTYA